MSSVLTDEDRWRKAAGHWKCLCCGAEFPEHMPKCDPSQPPLDERIAEAQSLTRHVLGGRQVGT